MCSERHAQRARATDLSDVANAHTGGEASEAGENSSTLVRETA